MPCTAENQFVPELPEETPDLIYLCVPNNPTGTTLTRDQDVYKRQDVKLGSRIVDAKSIVGVLSLAKSRTVEVIFHTDNCDNIIDQIAAIVPIAA